MWKLKDPKKKMRGKKVALVLGSGAARGLSHIGVIKKLIGKGIDVDMVVGSSIGALVGACYARNRDISGIQNIVLNTDWRKMAGLVDFNLLLTQKGLLRGDKVEDLLQTVLGDSNFQDLQVPLAVVATEIHTGKEVVINEGLVVEAVRASISIPVTFVPVKYQGHYLMDGGIVNPLPINVARQMGADYVIACDVSRSVGKLTQASGGESNKEKTTMISVLNEKIDTLTQEGSKIKEVRSQFLSKIYTIFPELKDADPQMPNIFYTLTQAVYSMEAQIAQQYLKQADIVIRPDVGNIDTYDFARGAEAIIRGEEAVAKVF